MFELDNQTQFEAALAPMNDRDWRPIVVVVVKGTYDILPDGQSRFGEKQLGIVFADKYSGKPGESSIAYESDVAQCKTATDVVMIGNAYSPHGREVDCLDVSLSVGPVAKKVRVFGDRVWQATGLGRVRISDPLPFTKMPLVYERAFGGVDQSHEDAEKHGWEDRNPVGVGYRVNAGSKMLDGQRLPNLETPDALISDWRDKPFPQGFGFFGRHWMPRKAYAGTFDERWENERAPALPEDFDARFFQSAHPDLIADPPLRGDEIVVATNVLPQGDLRLRLPGHGVSVVAYFDHGQRMGNPVLDTFVLMPDKRKFVLVWRSNFDCPRSFADLEGIRLLPTGGAPRRG